MAERRGIERLTGRPVADYKPRTCQFMDGDPKDNHFYGQPEKPGSSYCERHHKLCWIA